MMPWSLILIRLAPLLVLLMPSIPYYSDGFIISPLSTLFGTQHATHSKLKLPVSLAVHTMRHVPSEDSTDDDELLGCAIDSFLRGEYDREVSEDAPAPHPGLSPGAVVESSLRWLRNLEDPEPSHGAAVFLRFCLPLSRGDRWGDSSSLSPPRTSRRYSDPWKKVMRGALTPVMFARRLRASEFSCLLDWKNLDVTEGAYGLQKDLVGVPSMAFVNAALYFGEGSGIEPVIIQFTLRRIGGVWLIDAAQKSARELFVGNGN